ncbi:MAG TPA: glycosyltransferase [Gemmatimonadaceae bacterium]|nr:glycosyltransferase [Gemmatimonadaceae bacterium]
MSGSRSLPQEPAAGVTTRVPRLLTNARALLADAEAWQAAEGRHLREDATLREIRKAIAWLGEGDVLVVDTSSRLLATCGTAALLDPRRRWRLVALDTVLRTPAGLTSRAAARAKGFLFRQADLFILYFRDTSGYRRYYGLPATRMRFVPFKVNSWEALPAIEATPVPERDCLLCAGRSNRDVGVFLEAARTSGVPCVLLHQDPDTLRRHGTELALSAVPPNLRIEQDAGGRESWIAWVRRARALVVPVLPGTIAPSGISTYLDAMALGTPVIISACPAVSGMVKDEALIVPAGDPTALAEAMRRVWNEEPLRHELRLRGQVHAERHGGSARLHRDILACLFGGGGGEPEVEWRG